MSLNYPRTFLLGLGFLGVSVIWAIYNSFVPVFLDQKFHLKPAWVAFFISLDNIAALLIQPAAGAWSDRVRTRMGRRLPFVLVGAPISALAFAILPHAAQLPLFVLCTSTLLVSMALWRTPVMALVADVTPPLLRSQASGVISFMGGVGAIIAYFGASLLYRSNPALPFWCGALVVLLAALLLLLNVKEPEGYTTMEAVPLEYQPGFLASLRELIQDRDKSALFMMLALFLLMVSYTAIEGFFTLYALRHLKMNEADSARLLGQLSLVFVACAIPSGYLGARWGRRTTIMGGLLGMASLLLTMYHLPVQLLARELFWLPLLGGVPLAGLLLMVMGVCWAFIIIHPLPMLSNMTDNSRLGTYTGLYYLVTSLAAVAGPNLNGWLVQWSGGNYNIVMLLAPILMLISCCLMWGVKQGDLHPSDGPVAAEKS